MRTTVWVDPEKCRACERCAARSSCRVRAILQFEPGELPVVEIQRCMGCGACVSACPVNAIAPERSRR